VHPDDLRRERQRNQRLLGDPFADPIEAVRWFGAVQSQDFPAAKWGLGQRVAGSTDADLDAAFDAGAFVRVHVLRPTWHFVLPEDLLWMQRLTAARVKAKMATNDRKLGLDEATFARSNEILARAAQGRAITREEGAEALTAGGVALYENRLSHIGARAELDGVLCSGPQRGKQHTWMLVSERVRSSRDLRGDEALRELATMYFRSHGPATVRDFAWWSGLTQTDAKRGIAAAGLERVELGDRIGYRTPGLEARGYEGATPGLEARGHERRAHLLPNFDEYVVAYVDRDGGFDPMKVRAHVLVADGAFVGVWKRSLGKREVVVELQPAVGLGDAARAAIGKEAERYGAFLGLEARVV
jgi:hypothetical protein